jgi:hypothetical protein
MFPVSFSGSIDEGSPLEDGCLVIAGSPLAYMFVSPGSVLVRMANIASIR